MGYERGGVGVMIFEASALIPGLAVILIIVMALIFCCIDIKQRRKVRESAK